MIAARGAAALVLKGLLELQDVLWTATSFIYLSPCSFSVNRNMDSSQSEPQSREPSFIPEATTGKPKDPITCHVLDLVSGLPAPGLSVSLTLLKPFGPAAAFKALTNADGRVSSWKAPDGPSLAEIFENLREHPDGGMVWTLKFETEKYYGVGNTFFPEVEVKFSVLPDRGHYHVPLLLGPWSYTTYRGS